MIGTDIYGFHQGELDDIRLVVERALGIEFEAHDSLYFGDYYLGFLSTGEELRLQRKPRSDA